VQELKAHCGMLVRTYNELQEMRARLLQAAGLHARSLEAENSLRQQPPPPPLHQQQQQGDRRAGCQGPETPEHETLGSPAGASGMPDLQLSNGPRCQVSHA
jgi:hypothetical protein